MISNRGGGGGVTCFFYGLVFCLGKGAILLFQLFAMMAHKANL